MIRCSRKVCTNVLRGKFTDITGINYVTLDNEFNTKIKKWAEIPHYYVMILRDYGVESRGRDRERRNDNTERDGGWVELDVDGRVWVAHLEVG